VTLEHGRKQNILRAISTFGNVKESWLYCMRDFNMLIKNDLFSIEMLQIISLSCITSSMKSFSISSG